MLPQLFNQLKEQIKNRRLKQEETLQNQIDQLHKQMIKGIHF